MRRPITLTTDAWGNVIVARTLGNEGTFVAKLDKEGRVIWQQLVPLGEGAGRLSEGAVAAAEEPRDSVEPLLIDAEREALERDLRGPSRLFRGLGVAAVLAAIFAFGLVGGAALRHGELPGVGAAGAPIPAAAGIRGAAQRQARAAVDEVTLTVDDTVGFADIEDVSGVATSDEAPACGEVDESAQGSRRGAAPAGSPQSIPAERHEAEETSTLPVDPEPAAVAEASPSRPSEAPEPGSDVETGATGVVAIRKQTLELLEAGRNDEAAQAGMRLVAAAPGDAFSYLCLGAAFQAEGRIAEAATAYRTCVQFAKAGDVSECRALSGL